MRERLLNTENAQTHPIQDWSWPLTTAGRGRPASSTAEAAAAAADAAGGAPPSACAGSRLVREAAELDRRRACRTWRFMPVVVDSTASRSARSAAPASPSSTSSCRASVVSLGWGGRGGEPSLIDSITNSSPFAFSPSTPRT